VFPTGLPVSGVATMGAAGASWVSALAGVSAGMAGSSLVEAGVSSSGAALAGSVETVLTAGSAAGTAGGAVDSAAGGVEVDDGVSVLGCVSISVIVPLILQVISLALLADHVFGQ
jgi:hypothetical protein